MPVNERLLLLLLLLGVCSASAWTAAATAALRPNRPTPAAGAGAAARNPLHGFIAHQLLSDDRLDVLLALEQRASSIGVAGTTGEGQAIPAAAREEIAAARKHLALRVASFLSEQEGAEPYNGLSEPDSKCRLLLNTWMATCVFG